MSQEGSGRGGTLRQRIVSYLSQREWSFEELRRHLEISVRGLDDELRHVERSLRRGGRRLAVDPPRCEACGFAFRGREEKRFRTPGRCPRCRSERIRDAYLCISGR